MNPSLLFQQVFFLDLRHAHEFLKMWLLILAGID